MKTNKEIEKDIEFQQKKIWQLPENTILERQTILLIKEFILQALAERTEEIKKEIGGKKRNDRGLKGEDLVTDWTMGYNWALEDIKTFLKKLEDNK
jgi:hypothetical protein